MCSPFLGRAFHVRQTLTWPRIWTARNKGHKTEEKIRMRLKGPNSVPNSVQNCYRRKAQQPCLKTFQNCCRGGENQHVSKTTENSLLHVYIVADGLHEHTWQGNVEDEKKQSGLVVRWPIYLCAILWIGRGGRRWVARREVRAWEAWIGSLATRHCPPTEEQAATIRGGNCKKIAKFIHR